MVLIDFVLLLVICYTVESEPVETITYTLESSEWDKVFSAWSVTHYNPKQPCDGIRKLFGSVTILKELQCISCAHTAQGSSLRLSLDLTHSRVGWCNIDQEIQAVIRRPAGHIGEDLPVTVTRDGAKKQLWRASARVQRRDGLKDSYWEAEALLLSELEGSMSQGRMIVHPLHEDEFFPTKFIYVLDNRIYDYNSLKSKSLIELVRANSANEILSDIQEMQLVDDSQLKSTISLMGSDVCATIQQVRIKVILVKLWYNFDPVRNVLSLLDYMLPKVKALKPSDFPGISGSSVKGAVEIELIEIDDVLHDPTATFHVFYEADPGTTLQAHPKEFHLRTETIIASNVPCTKRSVANSKLKVRFRIPVPPEMTTETIKNDQAKALSDMMAKIQELNEKFDMNQLAESTVLEGFEFTRFPTMIRGMISLNLYKLQKRFIQFDWTNPVDTFNFYIRKYVPFYMKALSVVSTTVDCTFASEAP
ncbi:hypothetical protein CRM22_005380 [Opisthorchis felineus]|uniref:Vitellogenin domain-containing protein n=1 Tax=Opisthorchis felineus TaxID=147828 RepID=A0A4S2LY65_OPIFE|nr:hypothetical protein CRM22_005380 [Opisthorchis felineus]